VIYTKTFNQAHKTSQDLQHTSESLVNCMFQQNESTFVSITKIENYYSLLHFERNRFYLRVCWICVKEYSTR